MRVALLSDIHGNLVALDAVLADLARRGPLDEVVIAGDLVWAGPWPAQVVDRIRSIDSVVIQGNTDAFFQRRPEDTPPGKRESRFAEQLNWMLEQLGPRRAEYLASLPYCMRRSD
jgi:predicted phosphodiesterase